MVKHDHNSTYTRKAECELKHEAIKDNYCNMQDQIIDNKTEIRKINNKINATLIFAICTLIGIIMLFVKG